MNVQRNVRITIAAALAATALAACDHDAHRAGAAPQGTTAGQKLDNAVAQTKEDLARAGDKIKPALERAGDKLATVNAGDVAITTSIKTDYLKDPDLSVLKIDVDTTDGVVTLNGVAGTPAARIRAEKLAGAIKGVKSVKNNLTVKQG